MTVGDRTYKILSFSRKDEGSMNGYTMVERAKEMSAHLGKDDGEYLLEHQLDIPVASVEMSSSFYGLALF